MRDLGNEDDHAETAGERLGCGLQVDLGLPAPGRAVEQEVPAAFVVCASEPSERTLLRSGERMRLRLSAQGVTLGRLRQLLAPRALRRGDERQGSAGRRAVVVREPERELHERPRQRLDHTLDRHGLDPCGRRVLEPDHDAALPRPTEPHGNDGTARDLVGNLVRERPRERPGRHERVDRGVLRHTAEATAGLGGSDAGDFDDEVGREAREQAHEQHPGDERLVPELLVDVH
jgi:hypothetical protein